MAKAATTKNIPTSVKLSNDLKSRVEPFLSLRDMSFTELVVKALEEYMQHHPLSKEEQRFLEFKQKTTKK